LRRLVATFALLAAFAGVPSASADFQPIRRGLGESLSIPRLRAGTVKIIPARQRGRVTVILRLKDPPLAASGRSLQNDRGLRRLNVESSSSRRYLARLAASQTAAVAQLRRELPEAKVTRRFGVLLNGITVNLPARQLPKLLRMPFATKVYPSLHYTLSLNSSPSVIGAPQISAATGARGDGIKIGIVDDGVDPTNPFFNPAGYSYPAGFPRGGTKWTTPKVIVARSFPGPGAGRPGTLAVDPLASFHGTHVAGIAAGNAGTNAPPGNDHPAVDGLSGVAPRAYIGNYRVFTVPTPIGNVANTPEIVAAFEAAVRDGMDVINFSGGGAQTEPENDPMFETIANGVAAGVTIVISAGNDRDEFGLGSAGSPGVAPDAISVAATSNVHVFAPLLRIVAAGAPDAIRELPVAGQAPEEWGDTDRVLVDVRTIVGNDGKPVDPKICGAPDDPNGPLNPLPPRSLEGVIALASRGDCTFFSKAERAQAAGAIGLILVDNRFSEANGIPVRPPIATLMLSDLDGSRLRAYLATTGGRTAIRVGREQERVVTGRSGIITSFSSAGPTSFEHDLKPDVSAPGGQILSSTLVRAGGPFAVFDGTSMSAPHIAGAAGLLRQLHPTWSPLQIKSALMSTAGPAFGNTARTIEAPVVLGGAGLANLVAATDPKLFTEPASLSFGDLDISRGARHTAQLVTLTDANGGGGTWTPELMPQSATAGVSLEVPGAVTVPPGGSAALPVTIRATATATPGENYGLIVLRRGNETRRIPYLVLVIRPKLKTYVPKELEFLQNGDTRGDSRVEVYRYPTAPFGPNPGYTGPPVVQTGKENVYTILVKDPVANVGVAVVLQSDGARIDPWMLGSLDENDVQGYAGTPVNVNALTFGYRGWVGAAAASFPKPQRFYVSVDSGRDEFTGRSLGGTYVLRAWVNDVLPPFVDLLTKKVSAGRPLLAVRALDLQAGVDPFSIVIAYRQVLVGAVAYDPVSGIALIPLPPQAPELKTGRTTALVVASDFQESKNLNTTSDDIMPNTSVRGFRVRVVSGPVVNWLVPDANQCVQAQERLVVAASASGRLASVRFSVDGRPIATVKRNVAGLFSTAWKTKGVERGKHELRAELTTVAGGRASAARNVRVCR